MSAAASTTRTLHQEIENYGDDELNKLVLAVQDLLEKRKQKRQEDAREKARAILREAGLTSLDARETRRGRPVKKS